MIPLRDVIPSRTTPGVTIALIAANVLVFLWQILLPEGDQERFFMVNGLVPAHFSWTAAFTSMMDEASISRLYGSIHYRSDIEVGKDHGKRIGGYTIKLAQQDGAD